MSLTRQAAPAGALVCRPPCLARCKPATGTRQRWCESEAEALGRDVLQFDLFTLSEPPTRNPRPLNPRPRVRRYVHRVGRTARLGSRGDALLFLLPSERGYVEHLAAHGVALREQPAVPLLNHVLGADRKVGGAGVETKLGAGPCTGNGVPGAQVPLPAWRRSLVPAALCWMCARP